MNLHQPAKRKLGHHPGMHKMGVGYETQSNSLLWKCPSCNTTSCFGHFASGKMWTKWKSSRVRVVHSLSSSENYRWLENSNWSKRLEDLFHDNSFHCLVSLLLTGCTSNTPNRQLRIALTGLLSMLLSSLNLKDTVTVQKKQLQPWSSQLKDAWGDCPGTWKQTWLCSYEYMWTIKSFTCEGYIQERP